MKKIINILSFLVPVLWACQVNAQAIYLDKPIQAGQLILFPDIAEANAYYYLPNKLKLGTNKDGSPQFSFLRYVENIKTEEGEETRREGDGGGIIHAVVELSVAEDLIKAAERDLKRKTVQNAFIKGPVIYKSGTMALVSSLADETSGFSKKIIGLGPAPIIAGNKAAVSITLTKQGAKVLWESFKTSTPDMSFSFVMNTGGFRSPVKAKITADFDKIYEHHDFKAGLDVAVGGSGGSGQPASPFQMKAGVDLAFDQLRESGAIKIEGAEASEKMEQLIDIAYRKLADMMFEPFNPNIGGGSNQAQMEQMLAMANRLNADSSRTRGSSSGSASTQVKLNIAYQFKQVRKTGTYVLDFSKSVSDELPFRFDENFGAISCPKCFRQVNIDDPLYRQREILLSIDGLNADQFGKYVNFVTVSLKKDHGGGQYTIDEARIGTKDFAAANLYRLMYGWKDNTDNDRNKWLKYDYKTVWSFFGDHQIVQDWSNTDLIGLNLAPPFHPVSVSVEASPALIKAAGIRLVTTKFYYNYGGGEKVEQVAIRSEDPVMAKKADFMLNKNNYDYEYEIIWRLTGNRTVTTGRKKSNDTILYVDEIPAELLP
ncbi:hypothetical protein GVN16_03865 [Emticicia sp. CRIBPO]|uniref:hypothetical protein n=1 Tax=Emticicia sp. CRIBPO TaxID=2683258 RepID=UPI00141243BA|nr:hypothetical protein [Emticicia sp. CRIBPO]NBA84879.1 hypothetical protein [Emticicia sp. CRIBPO]